MTLRFCTVIFSDVVDVLVLGSIELHKIIQKYSVWLINIKFFAINCLDCLDSMGYLHLLTRLAETCFHVILCSTYWIRGQNYHLLLYGCWERSAHRTPPEGSPVGEVGLCWCSWSTPGPLSHCHCSSPGSHLGGERSRAAVSEMETNTLQGPSTSKPKHNTLALYRL